MNKMLFTFVILLAICITTRSQTVQVCQPDTVRLYYNNTISPYNNNDNYGIRGIRFTYDPDGLLTEYFEHEDLDEHGLFHVNYFNRYRYDEKHNLVWMDHSEGDWGAYWGDENNYVYTNGLIRWYTRYKYGQFIYDWDCDDSIYYHYNTMSLLEKTEVFEVGKLTKTSIYEYSDSETKITTEGLADGIWQQLNVVTKRFSDDGRLLNIETVNNSKPSTLVSYFYDEEGRLSSILTQTMENKGWINSTVLDYSYYTNGKLQLAQLSTWQNDEFVTTNRAVYELDTNGNIAVVTFEKWDGTNWTSGTWQKGFFVFSDHYLKNQNDILCRRDVYQLVFHYANTTMPDYDIDERPTGQNFATLHPNPTTGQLTVTGNDLKQAEVFNALGQRVATINGEGGQLTMDISKLPAGVYFVNVTDAEGRKCVKKVVKE